MPIALTSFVLFTIADDTKSRGSFSAATREVFPRKSTPFVVANLGMYARLLFHFTMFGFAYGNGRPPSPRNLSLERVTSTSAKVRWEVDKKAATIPTQFDMTVSSLNGTSALSRVEDVDGTERNHTLDSLLPETQYEVYMVAYNAEGQGSNASDVIAFRTLPEPEKAGGLYVNPGEVLVVVFILTVWICAIALFLNKWSKIRITPSLRAYHGNKKPMNIDTIKVVKKNTDSVIYRNYSKEINRTMIAREKRIHRMRTMPNIKVGKEKEQVEFSNKEKTLERMKTVPLLPGIVQEPEPKPTPDLTLSLLPKFKFSRTPFDSSSGAKEKTVPLLAEVAEESHPSVESRDISLEGIPPLKKNRSRSGGGAKLLKEKPLKRIRTSPLLFGVKEEPQAEMTSML